MSNDEITQISNDGLRYTAKENGSPFQGMGSMGETRSCIQCGKHKPRTRGAITRFLNSPMFICFDCKPPKTPL